MKKLIFILFSTAILIGCGQEDIIPVEQDQAFQKEEINDPRLLQYLDDYNLKGKAVMEFMDGYLVDGDIYVPDELLDKYKVVSSVPIEEKKGAIGKENLQYKLDNIVSSSPGTIKVITYRINSSVPSSGDGSDWRTAIHNAFTEWGNVRNIRLQFEEVVSGTADININAITDNFNTNIIAAATLPSGGNPGNSITINLFHNSMSISMKLKAIAHEIGHTVGFHHSDYNEPGANPNNIPGSLIQGTFTTDQNSVMNHLITSGWTGFSYRDILAIRHLYPLDGGERPLYTYRKDHSPTLRSHCWTGDWSEFGMYNDGFNYRGPTGFLFNYQKANTVPLYRYKHTVWNTYYMSTNPNISDTAFAHDKVLGYVYNSHTSASMPVYVYYHPNDGHYFTNNSNEPGVSGPGWTAGGIAFYVAMY